MSKKLYNQFICSRMMLPEHVRALSKHEQESKLKELCWMPELDKQRLEEFDRILQKAVKEEMPVRLTVMTGQGLVVYEGKVQEVDRGKLYLEAGKDAGLKDILDIDI